jgi:hypothetical protein
MSNDENVPTASPSREETITNLVEEMTGEMLQISRKLEPLYTTRDALYDQTDINLMDEYICSLEDQIRLVRDITVRKICAIV